MSEERDEEQAIREETSEMAQTADRMEQQVDELGDDIDEAKKTAAQRQDAPDETVGPDEPAGQVAGDWEGEAAGADQGDDATDSGEMDKDDDA
jgi:hypothetical protein